jgi:hypothetical protein
MPVCEGKGGMSFDRRNSLFVNDPPRSDRDYVFSIERVVVVKVEKIKDALSFLQEMILFNQHLWCFSERLR